jgi:CRISPR-associated protein Csb2
MTSPPLFALRVEFLTGQYCAQAHDDRGWPEWPPHPARLFSALVAAWAQAGEDPTERVALEWLERLPAPAIQASEAEVRGVDPARSRGRRDRLVTVTNYVPVNDACVISPSGVPKQYDQITAARAKVEGAESDAARAKAAKALATQERRLQAWSANAEKPSVKPPTQAVIKEKLGLLPDGRAKQPRTFPVAIPDDPVVHLVWEGVDAAEHAEVLDKLASRVARVGHSSSLVSISVVKETPSPTLVPAAEGIHIRVPGPGQLKALIRAHDVHGGVQPRQLPFRSQMYREAVESQRMATSHLAGEWLVLEADSGTYMRLADAMAYTQAIRSALMSHAAEPIPRVLSGHELDGSPALSAHLTILPLPFVGREFADGGIRGFALMMPRDATTADGAAVAGALQSWGRGTGGRLTLLLPGGKEAGLTLAVESNSLPWTLQRYRWSRPSRIWTSATPLAFDRSPGRLWSAQASTREAARDMAQEVVGVACERIGLPRPAAVEVMQAAGLVGVPDLRAFPTYQSPGRKVRRLSAHVSLRFDQPVRGPLVLGAGRFFGMGLFAPIREGSTYDVAGH